jgi:hypothetical protein
MALDIEFSNPPFGASNTLRIIENILKMRKLWPSKIMRVKNSIILHFKGDYGIFY